MWTLLVYTFRNAHYIALIGGSSSFKTKEEILCTGQEQEIFSISRSVGTPFLELIREVIAEADKRGIRDIKCMEDILMRPKVGVVIPSQKPN